MVWIAKCIAWLRKVLGLCRCDNCLFWHSRVQLVGVCAQRSYKRRGVHIRGITFDDYYCPKYKRYEENAWRSRQRYNVRFRIISTTIKKLERLVDSIA